MIKKCFIFILAVCTYLGLEQLVERSTRGFWIERVKADNLSYQAAFETTPSTKEELASIKTLLKQPFYLMGSGSECFAFISQDGKYVIKLFKLDHLRPVYLRKGIFRHDLREYASSLSPEPPYQKYFPKTIQNLLNRVRGIREFRVQRTFQSIVLAYNQLKKETALVYVHLNPSEEFTEPLVLYDSCHIAHQVDPNAVRFVIQETATPFIPHMKALIKAEKKEEIERSLSSLLDLLIHRCKNGLADRDIIARNFGFVRGDAIEIDTGSFSRSSKMKEDWIYTQEIYYATLEIRSWLEKQNPQIATRFSELVDEKISQEGESQTKSKT